VATGSPAGYRCRLSRAALGCDLASQACPLLEVGEKLAGHLNADRESWLNSSVADMRPG
jgi:hypothetical protein